MMSGIIALLQGATILYFGNSANAMSIRANDLPVYFTNDTTGNGANSSSSSDIPCLSEFASCGTDEVCMQCMLAIIAEGDDEDSDGDVSVTDEESDGDVSVTDDSDEDGEDDDDDLSEISCDTLSSMTCDMYGTNTTCLNNDAYETYIECSVGSLKEDCTIDLCAGAMGFARFSGAATFVSAAVAGLLVATLGKAL